MIAMLLQSRLKHFSLCFSVTPLILYTYLHFDGFSEALNNSA